MRSGRLAAGALAALLAAALAAPLAAGPAHAVTAGRVPGLWATVNRCDPPDAPGAVGVRVAIPRRPGGGAQWARVRLQFWDGQARAWRRLRSGGDGGWVRLGSGARAVKGGETFTFEPPQAGRRLVLRGVVTVEWRKRRRAVERRRLLTSAGHADPGDPLLAVSRRSCEIRR
jgi:hypothetical protein